MNEVTTADVIYATRTAYGIEGEMFRHREDRGWIPYKLVADARVMSIAVMRESFCIPLRRCFSAYGLAWNSVSAKRMTRIADGDRAMFAAITRMAACVARTTKMPHAGSSQLPRPCDIRQVSCEVAGGIHATAFSGGMSKKNELARESACKVMRCECRMSLHHIAECCGLKSHTSVMGMLRSSNVHDHDIEFVAAESLRRTRLAIGTGPEWAWPAKPVEWLLASKRAQLKRKSA